MKQIWFKRIGWTYLPIHPIGYLITMLVIILMVSVCLMITKTDQAVVTNIFQILVCGTCTAFWWKWIAEKTS